MSNPMAPTRPFGDSTNAVASTEFVSFATGGHPATFADAVASAVRNVIVPHPNLSSTGFFFLDGVLIEDQDTVFFPLQNNLAQNGLWLYTTATNTLSRPDNYASGSTITQPYFVSIEGGDTLGGTIFELQNPPSVVVDSTQSTWINSATGIGTLNANEGTFGGVLPTSRARPAFNRLQSSYDIQTHDPSLELANNFPATIFDSLSKYPKLSDYLDATNPWAAATSFNNLLTKSNVVIVDCAVHLLTQLSGPLSGKKLIFSGSGEGGPSRIVMCTKNSSFIDLTGIHDFIMEGFCRIQYPLRANAAIKAIKSTDAFSNVRIDSLYTSGVDFAISVTGAISGFYVREIGVADLVNDNPLNISSTSAPTSLRTRIGRINGRPTYQTDPAAGAAFTYHAWTMASVVDLNGVQTANRVITGALDNASEGYTATFLHNATGGFNYTIPGGKVIVNGQSATAMISNGVWVPAS